MQRRLFLIAGSACGAGLALPVAAHHGWGRYDVQRPLYLEGRAAAVNWANPHASFELQPAPDLQLPPDLARRTVPPQQAAVDAAAVLAAAQLPRRRGERWTVELAPLLRMQDWRIEPLQAGDPVSVVGYAAPGEEGPAVLRAEFLFAGGKAYGLRSSPA
jgi:hypothetical protein